MKWMTPLVVLFFAGTTAASAQEFPIRPNGTLTPGVIASIDQDDVCGLVDGLSYSKRSRHTPIELKRGVYAAYGIAPNGRDFEIDHRVPLCIGGADARENLWPQEGLRHPNFQDKDRLEAEVCRLVCRDHLITLREGQAIFLGDWIAGYREIFGIDLTNISDRVSGQ
jgi:hypothetical protein